jgi:hypothetical protein
MDNYGWWANIKLIYSNMDYKDFTKNSYFIIIENHDAIGYGEVQIGQTLTTSHQCEIFDDYNMYSSKLREFGIHLNLNDENDQ